MQVSKKIIIQLSNTNKNKGAKKKHKTHTQMQIHLHSNTEIPQKHKIRNNNIYTKDLQCKKLN